MRTYIRELAQNTAAQRFLRFVVVGLLNTAFGYAIYALFILVGLAPQPALVLSFSVGVIWNYFTTARLVFAQRGFSRLPIFIVCYVVVYALNAGALYLLISAGLSALAAQALITPFAAVLAFVLISFALTGHVFGGNARSDHSDT